MTIALWCVLVAGLLPYVATVIAKAGTDFDNRDPRVWLARQQGFMQNDAPTECTRWLPTP